MTTFPRTEEGFNKAFNNATWLANFHKKNFAISVSSNKPNEYVITTEVLVPRSIATGTTTLVIEPDA